MTERPPSFEEQPTRRGLIAKLLMGIGLAAGYGLGLAHFFRYLVPLGWKQKYREMYVGTLSTLPVGALCLMRDPDRRSFVLSRTGPDDVLALSSTCPHLGCQVHWEASKGYFLCPCHDGRFDAQGQATHGPPAEMGEAGRLERYAVRIRGGNIFVMVKDRNDVSSSV